MFLLLKTHETYNNKTRLVDFILFSELGLEFYEVLLVHDMEDCKLQFQPKKQTFTLVDKFGSCHSFIFYRTTKIG